MGDLFNPEKSLAGGLNIGPRASTSSPNRRSPKYDPIQMIQRVAAQHDNDFTSHSTSLAVHSRNDESEHHLVSYSR